MAIGHWHRASVIGDVSLSSVDQSPIARDQSSIISIDRSIASRRPSLSNHQYVSVLDHRPSTFGQLRRSPNIDDSAIIDRSIDRSPTIDNRSPTTIEHRSSKSVIDKHVFEILANDPKGKPSLGSVGRMDPGSPRRVEQLATRIEQPLELAQGPRVTSSMRDANIAPTRHVGAVTSYPPLRRVHIQHASNKSHARNK